MAEVWAVTAGALIGVMLFGGGIGLGYWLGATVERGRWRANVISSQQEQIAFIQHQQAQAQAPEGDGAASQTSSQVRQGAQAKMRVEGFS